MGTFSHCLELRHRINFGVDRTGSTTSRLAIPFYASNIPAKRSEWKQPDVAITLTILSYYYDGLSKAELRDALSQLLSNSAQTEYFNSWLALTDPSPEDLKKMDDVRKVDLSNIPQMDLMHEHFGRNYEVVNFWLNSIVLPRETKLCPRSMGTNAWFLAYNTNGAITGFSGTNDNHRLLPLHVRRSRDDALPALSGTNGRMLDLILQNKRYITLDQRSAGSNSAVRTEAWKTLLGLVVDERVDVLIDCGAFLGRITGGEAAAFLLSAEGQLSTQFRGVIFFDQNKRGATGGGWTVLDREGRYAPLNASPIMEAEAFCIYDEARCRGADLKLSPSAKALLTIGPKNCKDKVIQAAGRLRLLGQSEQSILFVGSSDVSATIRNLAGLGKRETILSKDVLGYIMANTVEATQSGLLQWALQGSHFLETFNYVDRAELNEPLTLDDTYGPAVRPISIARAVSEAREQQRKRYKDDIHDSNLADRTVSISECYGREIMVSRDASLAGECEREMELETELEEMVERQLAKVGESPEVDWDYDSVLSTTSASDLDTKAKVVSMAHVMRSRLSKESQIPSLNSSSLTVFCTGNFWRVMARMEGQNLDDYLRPVDAILVFENESLLLLSEREADRVLR
ncbi:unnamed protein product, partial [Ascophyllum nodosum]